MGKDARIRNERGYLNKSFHGRATAQEVWRQTLMKNHRCKCGALPVASAALFCPAADFEREFPALAVKYATENAGSIPIVKFKSSGSVRAFVALPVKYACQQCLPELERLMAHKPSWMLCEFHRGPAADRPMEQVPRSC
jgi:hypothetical protein